MKIAFVSVKDPLDMYSWSGSVSHMYRSLEDAGHEMIPIGNLKNPYAFFIKVLRKLSRLFLKKIYWGDWEPLVLKSYSRQVKRRLRGVEYDVLLSNFVVPIAELNVDKPMAFFADATFSGMIGFYEGWQNLDKRTVKVGDRAEQRGLDRCGAAIYASEWAAGTAIEHYDVSPDKVTFAPFGANIECDRTEGDIERILREKNWGCCRLLLIGVEWVRKDPKPMLAT